MDADDRPLSFAVPRGEGGIFERLFAGDIDWKATLVWLMLKLHSDWLTGITDKISMETLAKWTGFGKKTVCDAIKTLADAGMLQRLSEKWECSQFQLYPKPYKNRATRRRAKRQAEKSRTPRHASRRRMAIFLQREVSPQHQHRRDTNATRQKSRQLATHQRPRPAPDAQSDTRSL